MTASPQRRTIGGVARVEGTGLFTGAPSTLVLESADAGDGIVFKCGGGRVGATVAARTDEPPHPALAALGARNTSIAVGESAVHTVEHLLAACAGLGITDIVCRLEGPEVPIGDGSAAPFTDAIARVGLREFDAVADPVRIAEPVRVGDDDASIEIEPSDGGARFRYELDYGPGAPIGPQAAEWHGDPGTFLAAIAPARTFSLASEAAAMQAAGMFDAFTPRDLLVIDDEGEPMENEWRGDGEPARHKLLDLIGDLALATGGRPLHVRITARRSGHRLNHEAAALLAERLR